MKILRIFFDNIVWCQIDTSAEPTNLIIELKVADIHMDDRNPWIIRMDNNRNACRKKLIFFDPKGLLDLCRQFAMYCGEIDSSFFQNITMLDHTRATAAAAITFPILFYKNRNPVQLF